jgi:hypothetical protein
MRRFILTVFIATGFVLCAPLVHAQSSPPGPNAYVKPRLGLTQYTGENSPLLLTGPCGNSALDCSRSSYGIGLEVGLHLSPALGASVAYQTASYASIAALDDAPDYTRSHRIRRTAQMLAQYRFHTVSARLTPYVQAGMHVTTGHTPIRDAAADAPGAIQVVERWAFGPSFTAGLDVPLSRYLAVFAEVATNVAFPDDALDGHGGFIGFDRLSWAGVGLKIRNVPLPARLSPSAPPASSSPAPPAASAPSTLTVDEMGRFDVASEAGPQGTAGRFRWTFSDGTVREGSTVTKQFSTPGSYRAQVHRVDDNAHDLLHTFQVRVHHAASPVRIESISVSPDTLRPGQPIALEPVLQSGTPAEYQWDFGDGTVAFTRVPTHTYAKPGRYVVTLTVTNAAGQISRELALTIGMLRSAPDASTFPYLVQLGAFSDADRAERFARRHVSHLPRSPFVQHDATTGYHRVGLPYEDVEGARKALRALRQRAPFTDAFLQRASASSPEVADRNDGR